MPLSPSGNIRAVPLPLLLQELQQGKASGTLTLVRGGVKKSVFIKNGQIVFATSTEGNDRLGEILVKAGLITSQQLETGLAEYRKNVGIKKLGAILVEHGFVSPKGLFTGLKSQVKDIIYSLFLWDQAEYQFNAHLPPDIIELHINLQELIEEIIARIKREG